MLSRFQTALAQLQTLEGAVQGVEARADALCSQAVSMLMTAYGAEAGNVALKFMPVRTLADDLSRWAALLRT